MFGDDIIIFFSFVGYSKKAGAEAGELDLSAESELAHSSLQV